MYEFSFRTFKAKIELFQCHGPDKKYKAKINFCSERYYLFFETFSIIIDESYTLRQSFNLSINLHEIELSQLSISGMFYFHKENKFYELV